MIELYPVPLRVMSIHFQHKKSQAIPLKDPRDDFLLGTLPEWIFGRRNEPAAYKRGACPDVVVQFLSSYFAPDEIEVCAFGRWQGSSSSLESRTAIERPLLERTKLCLSGAQKERKGSLTRFVEMRFTQPLPDQIGKHSLSLFWFVSWVDQKSEPKEVFIGTTTHTLCTTWRHAREVKDENLMLWSYAPLMLWTSQWCAGLDDSKAICDAIIENLSDTGLQYGIPGWDVRYMLLTGGGMCGGWVVLFQQMAHCQGVFVEWRCFHLVPKRLTHGECQWLAMVVTQGGINQPQPSDLASIYGQWRDAKCLPPLKRSSDIILRKERRYCFDALPKYAADGHCINFLQHDGALYVYDPSFHRKGIKVEMRLPSTSVQFLPREQARSFTRDYLDQTVAFIMNAFRVGRHLHPVDLKRDYLGVTVSTDRFTIVPVGWKVWPRSSRPSLPRGSPEESGSSALHRYLMLRANQVGVFHWEELREALAAMMGRCQWDEKAQNVLLRLLKSRGTLVLNPSAPVPHAMAPSDMLKFLATQALVRSGLKNDVRFQRALRHVAATAVSVTLRTFIRELQRKLQKASLSEKVTKTQKTNNRGRS